MQATMDLVDGDYLGAYRRFLENFVATVCGTDDQLPVKMGCRDVRELEIDGAIADITLQHLDQKKCPASLQAYLVKLAISEFKAQFQKQPEECGYRIQEKTFSPLKLMQAVTSKVNEICQRYLDNSRLALLPPPPSIPLPLASSHAIKNRRRKMEDRSVVLHDLHTMFSINNDSVVNYYAVFDGHGGIETAVYCAAHLHQYLLESPHYPTNIEIALRDAFFTTDSRFSECDETKNSGATAVCALLYDKTLYIAWAGDSQAALIKNGRGINLTIPHKPEREDEKERIESLGGEIIFYGSWRVNGVLNVSRAIGDFKYKPFISTEPEIKTINLDGSEDFLVIACDGFWEKATEDIVASLMYEYVTSNQSQYSSASEALVSWAKQNQSDDNISVIVVFLTPPEEIASKNFYQGTRAAQKKGSMDEPGYQSQEPYDTLGFAKSPLADFQSNGQAAVNFENGRLRQTPPKFHYDDDDDDDDEDEVDDQKATNGIGLEQPSLNGKHTPRFEYNDEDDVGPESAVDDVPDDFGKLDQAMAPSSYPDEFLLNKSMSQREAEAYEAAAAVVEDEEKRPRNELGDNVAESEESEDEWNYYRPEGEDENEKAKPTTITAGKDPALVEKPDRCETEKELCSPKPSEEDNDDEGEEVEEREHEQLLLQQEQPTSSSGAAAVGEVDDEITAEFDDLHHNDPIPGFEHKDVEADTTAVVEEDLPFDKEQPAESDKKQFDRELYEDYQDNEEDMDSPLNPDAAEFVPVSPTNALSDVFGSDLISGSPLKQSQRALRERAIPSEEEFKEEISHRPSDIDDTTSIVDFSNGDLTPHKSSSFARVGGFEDSKQTTLLFDESEEMSSTKAECGGDDTIAEFTGMNEGYKAAAVSNMDSSFTGSDRGGFNFSNPMTTSMTPNDFKTAFEQDPDLNQVHELKDEDLSDVQNGSHNDKLEDKLLADVEEEDDLGKDKIEVDLDKLPEHQQQHIEVFSAEVEERYSDNKDLFMNQRNTENSSDFEKSDNLGDLSSGDTSAYASSNPFASEYAPSTNNDLDKLTEGMQNVNIEEPQQQKVDEDDLLAMNEPTTQEKTRDVMQNPLDLNFEYNEDKNADQALLVSPVKDPEVMSNKFTEEENILAQEQNNATTEQDEFFSKTTNHVEDFSTVPSQPVNLSESLHEFTGLEDQLLIPKISNGTEEPQVLKENLVDELKDVEEISLSPKSDEAKVDLSSLTNESNKILSNEIVETKEETPLVSDLVVAGAAAAAAATVAKSATKSATATSKTNKPAAPKPTTKSSTAKTTTTTAAAKKPASTTATSRPKSAVSATPKPPTSAATKTATKTSIAPKSAASTATKATPRPSTAPGSAAPRPKPMSSVTSKVTSTLADKKKTTNGIAAARPSTAPRTAAKTPASTNLKTGLVKTTSATRTSSVGASTAAAKPRPPSATAKTTAKPSSGLTNNTTASNRPKTAPASTLSAVTKSKVTTTTKSPMIDKQIKETANKQISSARAPAAPKARQSLAPTPTASSKRSPVTTKTRMSLAPPKTSNSTASPAKKITVTSLKPNLKNVTSKVNSKVTSTTTKTSVTPAVESKPVQNGVYESNETVVTSNITTTTVTTNIEEDLPKKDVSPIEQPTDNQLISAE